MPFIEINGLPGKVFVPETLPDNPKKHQCPDCFSCQMCSDTRCRVCKNHDSIQKTTTCACKRQVYEKQNI